MPPLENTVGSASHKRTETSGVTHLPVLFISFHSDSQGEWAVASIVAEPALKRLADDIQWTTALAEMPATSGNTILNIAAARPIEEKAAVGVGLTFAVLSPVAGIFIPVRGAEFYRELQSNFGDESSAILSRMRSAQTAPHKP